MLSFPRQTASAPTIGTKPGSGREHDMDREDFPTLQQGDTGWPVMRIPFGSRDPIEVEYNEGGNEYEDTIMIRTGGRPVRIWVDGVEVQR